MSGADTLVITTGPAYHCKIPSLYIGCKFYSGAALKDRHVILLINDLTTKPDNFLDKIDNSHGTFYALNGEAFTMASGVPFTILKPNGLNDGDAGKQEIIVAHDDQ